MQRCRSSPTPRPDTSATPAWASAENRCEVPVGPWHHVYVTGSTSRFDGGIVCGTTKPPSSNSPTDSTCWAPWTAASTKSCGPSAAPATASAEATPAVPWE